MPENKILYNFLQEYSDSNRDLDFWGVGCYHYTIFLFISLP